MEQKNKKAVFFNFTRRFIYLTLLIATSCTNKNVTDENTTLFTVLDYKETNIYFKNNLKETLYMNGLFYEYYYNGSGVATGDFNNDQRIDIYFVSSLESNKLFLNKGNLKFEDVTEISGTKGKAVFSTGVTTVDINADGLLDIYICSSGKFKDADKRRNELYLNTGFDKDGIPHFKENAKSYGLDIDAFSTQATFFDYDCDGDLDMFLINHDVETYGDDKLQRYLHTMGELSGERLYRNENGIFKDVTYDSGITNNRLGFGLGVAVGDVNNDGWPDVYVGNDFSGKDHLYINNQNGKFSEIINESMRHISFFSMGNDIADYNNDGWLDIMTVDMVSEDNYGIKTSMGGMNVNQFYTLVDLGLHHQYMFNALQTNNGTINGGKIPYYSETAHMAGISNTDWSWAPLFFDMDNDGFQDLFIANGIKRDFRNNDFIAYHKNIRETLSKNNIIDKSAYINHMISKMPTRKKNNYFFLNNGDLTFSKIKKNLRFDSLKTASTGASYADFDNDGDLDIAVNNMDDYAQIYRNNASDILRNNFLKIQLKGPKNNPMGIGARVSITNNCEQLVREQYLTRGFQSSVGGILHFGVGKTKKIEQLHIKWNDGATQVLKNIPTNQTLVLAYKKASFTKLPVEKHSSEFTNVMEANISFCHKENLFNDFERESLLPHKMSEQGPAVAVADINADGLDDLFLGGSMGNPGAIYLQNTEGDFVAVQKQLMEDEKLFEDVSATFFDADRDGDMDLYLVSGGNEKKENSIYYQDRLYTNMNGIFERSKNALPVITSSGSCVKPFDYDMDGDLDLFIGGRQTPGKYPLPTNSYILENQSTKEHISFVDVSTRIAPMLKKIGMVTDAVWVDIDGDSLTDLVIVGEWMPITVLKNQGNYFKNCTEEFGLLDETGWWYSIVASDFDKDGDIDLVAGNLGLNYKYKASKKEPFEIYAMDFDSSGNPDIVLGYHNDGNLFPLRGRECSSTQMPFIKQKFDTYDAFGKATLIEVYGQEKLKNSIHYKANTFASTYFENNKGENFISKPLPKTAQQSSVNSILSSDFDNDGYLDLLLAGNLYGSEVETPRNDASYGVYLKSEKNGTFKAVPAIKSGLYIKGEVKHMRIIKNNDKKIIFIIKNNGCIQQLYFSGISKYQQTIN